jgi:hypothetical protein
VKLRRVCQGYQRGATPEGVVFHLHAKGCPVVVDEGDAGAGTTHMLTKECEPAYRLALGLPAERKPERASA